MAHLPATTDEQEITPQAEAAYWGIVEAYARGMTPPQIAKQVYPNDRKKRLALRQRLWRQLSRDVRMQQYIAERAQAIMLVNLIPVTEGVVGRAKRGRPDAAKLIFEASGFHNPRIKHEHSGDIKITLDVPRPKAVDTTATEE